MSVVDDVKRTLAEFPSTTADAEELARLMRFLAQMRRAGLTKMRDYDLPRPDTIGRSLVTAEFRRRERGHTR
jgi:hypothetical protein